MNKKLSDLTTADAALMQLLLRIGLTSVPDSALLDELAGREEEIASRLDGIIGVAGSHTLLGPVSDALSHLSDSVELPVVLSSKLLMSVSRTESENALQLKALSALGRQALKCGVRVVLQKGQNSASLYPDPSHRTCGDIDIYPPDMTPEEFVKTMGIPQDKVEKDPDGGLLVILGGQVIEIHHTLMDLSDSVWRRVVRPVVDSEGYVAGPVEGILAPGPVATLLMFNTHILKHAMGHGIGLRQFCDLWLAYRKWGGDDSIMTSYRSAVKSCGISRWTEALDSFLESYFDRGEPLEGGLFGKILAGGNFGHGSEKHEELVEMSSIRRKIKTFGALFSQAGFGLRYAPREYFCYVTELIKGQI